MTLVQGRSRLAQRGPASETPTGLSSYRSDQNQDYKDPLGSNKSPARLYKTFARPSQALPPEALKIDAVLFTQKDLDQIIKSVF